MRRAAVWAIPLALRSFGAEASTTPDLPAAARDALRGGGYQTELPVDPKWPGLFNFSLPPALVEILLWGGVGLGIVLVALAMRDSIPALNRSRRLSAAEEAVAGAATPDTLSAAQIEADELAARGAFAEAMHLLLLRALGEVRERLQVTFADSLTSREILRRAPLDVSARQAFSHIIGEVELTHFGDTPAGGADYARCRSHFDVLRRALAVQVQR